MRKGFYVTMMLAALTVNSVIAKAETVSVIGEAETVGDDWLLGEVVTIDKVCDLTYLGCVVDSYAMSMAAYARDEDELIETPEAKSINTNDVWGNRNRYKFKMNGDSYPYYDMYIDIGAAIAPSTEDYMIVDCRFNILNRSISPLTLDDIKGTITYADEYEFDLTCIKEEETDSKGNKWEWLADTKSIPSLVDRNIHLIFEIPNRAATDTAESLVAFFEFFGNSYELELR